MEREKLLNQALSLTLLILNFIAVRDRDPRQYGTDEYLYMTEVDTLAAIGDRKTCTAVEIAQRWHISKSAVSKTIRKLESHDLICKIIDPKDGRRVLLSLSPRGKKVYQYHKKLDKATNSYMVSALGECTQEELAAYVKVSSCFHKAMIRKLGPSQGWKDLSSLLPPLD